MGFRDGDRTICKVCQGVIIYNNVYWRHIQPFVDKRHIAAPFDNRAALEKEQLLNRAEYRNATQIGLDAL